MKSPIHLHVQNTIQKRWQYIIFIFCFTQKYNCNLSLLQVQNSYKLVQVHIHNQSLYMLKLTINFTSLVYRIQIHKNPKYMVSFNLDTTCQRIPIKLQDYSTVCLHLKIQNLVFLGVVCVSIVYLTFATRWHGCHQGPALT